MKSPEPTTINSVLEENKEKAKEVFAFFSDDGESNIYLDEAWRKLDKEAQEFVLGILKSAILKTCDEILATIPSKAKQSYKVPTDDIGGSKTAMLSIFMAEDMGYEKCRQAIESKVKELKGEV